MNTHILLCLALWCALGTVAVSTSNAATEADAPALGVRVQVLLDRALQADASIPGALLSISAPSIHFDWAGASGRIAIDGPQRLVPNQPFRIASVTKVFVAAAIFKLSEQRQLALYGSISTYLTPETRNDLRQSGYDIDRITIQQLLSHTGGLYDYADDPAYSAEVAASPRKRWTRSEQIRLTIEHGKPVGLPGERFAYSDTNYLILGEIIEGITHQPLPAAIRSLLQLDALGLKSTYFESLEPAPHNSLPLAHQYWLSTDFAGVDPSFDLFGGGGIVSTTTDLNRFMRALLQGHLFALPQTLASALMTVDARHDPTDHLHANLLTTYPFGRRMCWGHRGVWATEVLYCPDIDLALTVTLNQSEELDGPVLKDLVAAIADEFEKIPGFSLHAP